ncbi:hypothetical protein ACTQ49_02745 [Luteococcus sp. Sow4_B9]|uniref:hypothetical protein n=1 Tax=Luteococcus sp. Sow4_B9 TaxID=3438792 RepID=UPI003F948BC4
MLRDRFLAFAAQVAPDNAEALARAIMVAYNGTTAMMLRVPWQEALDDGEATARMLVRSSLE